MPGPNDLAEDRDVPWEDDRPHVSRNDDPDPVIYYRLPDTPAGHHIKEYANGRRQLVRFVGVEEQVVKFSLD